MEGRSWTTGNVTAKTGPLSFSYQVDVNGSTWRRHVDQMNNTVLRDDLSEPIPPVYVPDIFTPRDITSPEPLVVPDRSTKLPPADHPVPSVAEHQEPLPKPDSTPRRYPQRIRKPTQKLDLFKYSFHLLSQSFLVRYVTCVQYLTSVPNIICICFLFLYMISYFEHC